MPIIKPISDLRNKTNHISDLVHKSHEPVFITKNGEGDMVLDRVMADLRKRIRAIK
jgi:PHD/YefM family antitoxin component YafN of YafNO toxin-antitoxin module